MTQLKMITLPHKTNSMKIFLSTLLALGCAWTAQAQDTAASSPTAKVAQPDSGGISDAEIRDVVARVAKHQLHPTVDGNYLTATNLGQAMAAKPPEGIEWDYPWGVALYGMMRSTVVTGDKEVGQFVVEHNLICARYYEWLAGLETKFGTSSELDNFERRGSLGR